MGTSHVLGVAATMRFFGERKGGAARFKTNHRRSVAIGLLSPQLTAFFTSAPIRASSAAVNSFSAKAVGHTAPSSRFAARSEERRVGKECRSRWSAYH